MSAPWPTWPAAASSRRCSNAIASATTTGEWIAYLQWRNLPLAAAVRAGLLGHDGCEVLGGRIVLPELRLGWPVWLIGRQLGEAAAATNPHCKYLGLPGCKPLLGWEESLASGLDQVTLAARVTALV